MLLERVIAEAHDASDDMTLCLLRPVAGAAEPARRASRCSELDADDVESGFAARFLDACGVPADECCRPRSSAHASSWAPAGSACSRWPWPTARRGARAARRGQAAPPAAA